MGTKHGGVHLDRTPPLDAEIDELAALAGGRVGLSGLLQDLKWQARRARTPRLLGRAVAAAFAWDRYDSHDPRWWPQGLSTSADASPQEVYDGRRVLVATAYSKVVAEISMGARVTFVDLDSLRYRHVMLVQVRRDSGGELQLSPLHIHAGGIVWAGDSLHVAATARGFFTASVNDIMRVPGDDGHPLQCGISGNRVHSFGHSYALPVRLRHRAHAVEGTPGLRYSFMSLDRDRDQPGLLVGEYGRGSQTQRLARFPLDATSLLPQIDTAGIARPEVVRDLAGEGVRQLQGAVHAEGRYYLTSSRGPWAPGTVYVGRPDTWQAHPLATPMGVEDVTWWPSEDRLWSLTEHPRRRWVFAMQRRRFD